MTNNYQVVFLVIYGISTIVSLYKLSLGDKIEARRTHRAGGIVGLMGVFISVPLYLASIGVI